MNFKKFQIILVETNLSKFLQECLLQDIQRIYLEKLYKKFIDIYCENIEEKKLDNKEIDNKLKKLRNKIDFYNINSMEDLENSMEELWNNISCILENNLYQVRIDNKVIYKHDKEKIIKNHEDYYLRMGWKVEDIPYLTFNNEIDFNFAIPKKINIPNDMRLFYQIYGDGLELNKLTDLNHLHKFDKNNFLKINEFYVVYLEYLESNAGDFILDQTFDGVPHININDWFIIFNDDHSVDNGAGSLVMNLNQESPLYGNILCYSSNDEGTLKLVAETFTELIEWLVRVPIAFLETDDIQCWNSICDHLNQWCLDYCWKDIENETMGLTNQIFNYNRIKLKI